MMIALLFCDYRRGERLFEDPTPVPSDECYWFMNYGPLGLIEFEIGDEDMAS